MKALTGLPSSAYLKIAEEADVPLSDLLTLVSALESGLLPAYIARYRRDVSADLDEERIQDVHSRLRYFLDFEDRRIRILTAVGQKHKLTDELRSRIESAVERRQLEDLYLPFRDKPKTAADEAVGKGLEPLARFLWDQEPPSADIEGVAQPYVKPDNGLPSAAAALRAARHIVARWLGEDVEIRGELRKLAMNEAYLVVHHGDRWRADAALRKKFDWLSKHRSTLNKVTWRHHLGLRRAVREDALRYELILPENKAVGFLLGRLLRDRRSLFCLHLGAAASEAYQSYLAPALRNEVWHALTERCDKEAIQAFKKNLRRTLMAPPAGPITTIAIEAGRPGGWRAAVVDGRGRLLEAAIVHREETEKVQTSPSGPAPASDAQPEASSAESEPAAPAKKNVDRPSNGASSTLEKTEAAGSAGKQHDEPKSETSSGDSTPSEQPPVEDQAAEDVEPRKTSEVAAEAPATVEVEAPEETKTTQDTPKVAATGPKENSERSKDSGAEPEKKAPASAEASLSELISKNNVEAFVLSNGRGLRQVERLVRSAIRQAGAPKVFWTTVTEGGTWIYATSKAARRELPDVEPAVRSAVSLARRLQDPLAELIKIDPKLLGIGQYHSEIEPNRLRVQLLSTTEACVHQVGVDLNEASPELLACVPGITPRVAKRIVSHREKNRFTTREQLKKVPGISERLYRQAVGFFRVHDGENVLDTTGIHPQSYPVVEKMLSSAATSAKEALEKPEVFDSLNLDELATEECPKENLQGILYEFRASVRNPRQKFVPPQPPVELKPADGIKVGIQVEGIVTKVADFGTFVDIGADQDGLVHNSQISEQFRENGKSALKPGDRIWVRVLSVDQNSSRISLTTKSPAELARAAQAAQRSRQRPGGPRPASEQRRRRKGPDREVAVSKRSFGPDQHSKSRESERLKKLSLDEKLSLLETKFRTKI